MGKLAYLCKKQGLTPEEKNPHNVHLGEATVFVGVKAESLSFKTVSKRGTRYRPKPLQIEEDDDDGSGSLANQSQNEKQKVDEGNYAGLDDKATDHSNDLAKSQPFSISDRDDLDVSFSLNLFPNGFSVGKVTESFNDAPEQLHPYDRASETLFSIRDYRKCSFEKGGTSAIDNSPLVHRVPLHMCMENVVKDILSISNDSWTYKDILEVESRILRALQPDLHLNPEPLHHRHNGEPLIKKVNLGISWSWKQEKRSIMLAANLESSNSPHVNPIPVTCATQDSGLVYKDRGIMCVKDNTPSSVLNRENNIVRETNSQSKPLTFPSNYHLVESRNLSALTALSTSNCVSVAKQSFSKSTGDLRKPSSSVLVDLGQCGKLVTEGPPIKRPKQEPLDFCYQRFAAGGQSEINSGPHLPWQNNLLHQQLEVENALRERFQDKVYPSPSVKNCQPEILEGISKIQAGWATSNLDLQTAKTCFPSSDVRNINNNCFLMDKRLGPSDCLPTQEQQSPPLLKTNNPLSNTLLNNKGQPVDRNLRNGSVNRRRKDLENPQFRTDEKSASASSRNINSLPRSGSDKEKWKITFCPKGSSTNIVDSSASISKVDVARTKGVTMGIHHSPQTLEIKSNSLSQRFLKIEAVTQRYNMNNKEPKLDKLVASKPFFHITSLLASHFSSCEDNGRSQDSTMDKVSFSKHFNGRRLNVHNSRVLTFVHQEPHVPQGTPADDSEAQIRLVISEKLSKELMEATVIYGNEEDINSIVVPLLPILQSAHMADLFAAQFTSLMVREGYRLASDQLESVPLNSYGGSSSQLQNVIRTATPSTGTVQLPLSTLNPGSSHVMLSQSTNSMSAHNFMQLLSQTTFSGSKLLPAGNALSASYFSRYFLSKPQLDMAAQVSSLPPHWQQILSKDANFQFQLQQKQRQQLMQRKTTMGELTAGGLGAFHLGCGNQGLRNFSLGSIDNDTATMGSRPKVLEKHTPWIGNAGQSNNLGSNTGSINDSNYLLGLNSNSSTTLPEARAVEGQVLALPSGMPRNASVFLMDSPNFREISSTLGNKQRQCLDIHQKKMQSPQLQMHQQQQELRSPIQHPEAIGFAKLVGSASSQVSAQRTNRHGLNCISALEEKSIGKMMADQRSPEL
ncbi:protein PHYTOCHROME-DEPENDENT LATE-FLOWERING isoform X3 [Ziziphus jujuba]|uniref:Protein PHYTOCHROME-DEPENDENT LATE-FLOWERING isoform X3 n=1 Tax=Ziziphus jujuba TaxID=326968 RepID=A0ABM3I0Q5_ZIZJJ|nr:protein PHYTOCHROME-DEPENDENT LATE-FLOWERING isoform X3 [Ziziphus jujuba]